MSCRNICGADDPEAIIESPPENRGCCASRKVSACQCLPPKVLFSISTLVGSILLVLGTLALVGYFGPTSGGSLGALLKQLQSVSLFVASELGSDLFTLAIFTTAIGVALTAAGTGGLIQKCREEARESREFKLQQDA